MPQSTTESSARLRVTLSPTTIFRLTPGRRWPRWVSGVITLSRWSIVAAALAALVAFSDHVAKLVALAGNLPLPHWLVLSSQYKLEGAVALIIVAVALTLDW